MEGKMKYLRIVLLIGSVDKWDGILKNHLEEDQGGGNCPLCKEFFNETEFDEETGEGEPCTTCPVCEYTGRHICRETPYSEWLSEMISHGKKRFPFCRIKGCLACEDIAKRMKELLVKILEKEIQESLTIIEEGTRMFQDFLMRTLPQDIKPSSVEYLSKERFRITAPGYGNGPISIDLIQFSFEDDDEEMKELREDYIKRIKTDGEDGIE